MSKPAIVSSRSGRDLADAGELAPGRALGGERHDLARPAKPRAASTSSMIRPTAPVAPTTATRGRGAHRGASERVLGDDRVLAREPERGVQPAHRLAARDRRRSRRRS